MTFEIALHLLGFIWWSTLWILAGLIAVSITDIYTGQQLDELIESRQYSEIFCKLIYWPLTCAMLLSNNPAMQGEPEWRKGQQDEPDPPTDNDFDQFQSQVIDDISKGVGVDRARLVTERRELNLTQGSFVKGASIAIIASLVLWLLMAALFTSDTKKESATLGASSGANFELVQQQDGEE